MGAGFLVCLIWLSGAFSDQTLVIENVTVLPMDGGEALSGQSVVVEDGIIRRIAPTGQEEALASSKVVDGKGRYLMPGLVDMHTHLPGEQNPEFTNTHYLKMCLAAGVTTVRSMRHDPSLLPLRDAIRKGTLTAPNLYLAAPVVHKKADLNSQNVASFVTEAARQYDLIKVLSVSSPELFKELLEAAGKANVRVAGHVPDELGLENALALGLSSVEHLQGYSWREPDVFEKEIDATIGAGAFNCATLDWYFVGYNAYEAQALRSREGLQYLPPKQVQAWEELLSAYLAQQNTGDTAVLAETRAKEQAWLNGKLTLLKRMYDKGAKLLLSPDATGAFGVPGFGVLEEMKLYARAGIPNEAILRIATYNGAAYFGETNKWGCVREGRRADLLLLEKDPRERLEHVRDLVGVVRNGQWLTREALLAPLKEHK